MAKFVNCVRCGIKMYYGDNVEVHAFDHGKVYGWTMCARCASGFELPDKVGETLVTYKINNEGSYRFSPRSVIRDIRRYVNDYEYDIGGF